MRFQNKKKPEQWHTFLAGTLAGYLIMYKDSSYAQMKKQINMAIGIRTLYALMAYFVRNNQVPMVEPTAEGYKFGTGVATTLMWGVVMWHWRHETAVAPGEMNRAQVRQMDFIYNDAEFMSGWTNGSHLYWLVALLAAQKLI